MLKTNCYHFKYHHQIKQMSSSSMRTDFKHKTVKMYCKIQWTTVGIYSSRHNTSIVDNYTSIEIQITNTFAKKNPMLFLFYVYKSLLSMFRSLKVWKTIRAQSFCNGVYVPRHSVEVFIVKIWICLEES